MSNATPRLNPATAFLQMQKARAANTAIAEELAKPKTHTTQSNGYKVEALKPTLAATGEPVDIDTFVGIDPALGVHDLDDIALTQIMADDAELTALSGKIDDYGTWSNEPTDDDGSWMMAPTEVGLSPLFGRGARLREFDSIDEQDPHDLLDKEPAWGFHLVAA